MAADLRYPRLAQTDIDKFYFPDAEGQQFVAQSELQQELLRVLKNTNRLAVEPLLTPEAASRPALPENPPPPFSR
jgi:hypothetical protein